MSAKRSKSSEPRNEGGGGVGMNRRRTGLNTSAAGHQLPPVIVTKPAKADVFSTIFLPSAGSISEFAVTMLSTSAPIFILFYFLAFTALMALESTIFYLILEEDIHDSPYIRAPPTASIIIAFLFSVWFLRARNGYANLPGAYSNLLGAIRRYSFSYYNMIGVHDQIRKRKQSSQQIATKTGIKAPAPTTTEQQQEEDESDVSDRFAVSVHITRDACLALSAVTFALFAQYDQDLPDNFIEPVQELINRYGTRELPLYEVLECLVGLLNEQLNILMHYEGYLKEVNVKRLERELEDIKNIYISFENSSRVQEPPIFDKVMFLLLLFYLLGWVPLTQYAIYGWKVVVFAYPFEIMCIISMILVRSWIKSAFDPARPVSYMNFYQWRDTNYNSILLHFTECVDRVDRLKNNESIQLLNQKIVRYMYNGLSEIDSVTEILLIKRAPSKSKLVRRNNNRTWVSQHAHDAPPPPHAQTYYAETYAATGQFFPVDEHDP